MLHQTARMRTVAGVNERSSAHKPSRPGAAKAVGIAFLALLLGVGGWLLARDGAKAADKPSKEAAPPVAVTTAPVRLRDMPIYQSGVGTVAAAQSVTVRARVDGQLDQIGFTEGQDVKAGQLLARIDPRTLQAQLAQARAQRARDAALLANAKGDLKRYATLIAANASTQQEYDTQTALVAQLEAALQTDDAQINFAQVQLSFTTITAPISGRVGARLVDVGNIVRASDTAGLVVINQIDPISVVFTLPADGFQAINNALKARSTPLAVEVLPATGSTPIGRGSLVLLNNQIDTATGTVQLKGRFANPDHALWPGQYVNVRLVLGVKKDALTIPAAAVLRGQKGVYVYAVDADSQTVKNVAVEVGPIQDGIAIIEKGLSAGQRVVVDGQYKLAPGARVSEAVEAAEAAEEIKAPESDAKPGTGTVQ